MSEEVITDAQATQEIVDAVEREIGVNNIRYSVQDAGDRRFMKFQVGRDAPLYTYALHEAQKALSDDNPFRGALGITVVRSDKPFPRSLEANALLTLLTRSTREVVEGRTEQGYRVPYIPFQNREDRVLAQPATHIVRGRRGVGKSTLISRVINILRDAKAIPIVLDMQTYSTLAGDDLFAEVLHDVSARLAAEADEETKSKFANAAENLLTGTLKIERAPAALKRALRELTRAKGGDAFLFLDDFHLVDFDSQPRLLHYLNAAVKGAGGWLKVAGISSLLNVYSARTREGLQVPGDGQFISLDLTLENPEAAEAHLRTILESFLKAVGYSLTQDVIPPQAFRRLVWATAGVPRDFLQMFSRALEHAQRNGHSTVTISDVNIAIGEFGQQKMDDLLKDARNEADELKEFLEKIEETCLDEKKVNAFLVFSGASKARDLTHALSDLRMVHLIHRSITPDRAGERYEAYIIDYSIFTGFRRRRGVREMVPTEAQFKAADLRALPKIREP